MSTPDEDARKTEWREMRKRTMGELLQEKSRTGSNYRRTLIDMELERPKFVRDVMIDRWLAGGAIIVSFASLVVSVIALSGNARRMVMQMFPGCHWRESGSSSLAKMLGAGSLILQTSSCNCSSFSM
jgi:hypothetical protein